MDTSWWLALAAVILLALVATLVDGWGRRPADRGRPPGRPPGPRERTARPQPAEIWWASVPFEDRTASGGAPRSVPGGAARDDGPAKVRPCLVLAVHGRRATVVRITSKYRDGRSGVIPLPPGSVGDAHGRASFLETDELRDVSVWDFRRRVGVVDPALWDQVRHLAT
ncbi:type II toxin-antitoxin system PemK/MazF family toxin [Streptomyces sp. NPDC051041]|uniref:type II toxin-antitoxin system PemK/MazF family toxin n=1 Tax=Streptomyces sp. NPDC051041 TaxID=3365640 RepID=UPI0037AF21C1